MSSSCSLQAWCWQGQALCLAEPVLLGLGAAALCQLRQEHVPAQLCLQPCSGGAELLKMACSLCSCGASHSRFSDASVSAPCWGVGAKGITEVLREGQAAAPLSLPGTDALGGLPSMQGRAELQGSAGEGAGKERCVKGQWGSATPGYTLPGLSGEDALSLLSAPWCFGPVAGLGSREMGKPPSSLRWPVLAPLAYIGCCLLGRPGSPAWGLKLLCKRATQLAG